MNGPMAGRWSPLLLLTLICLSPTTRILADSIDQEMERIERALEELEELKDAIQRSLAKIKQQTDATPAESGTSIATIATSEVGPAIFTMHVDGSHLKPLHPMRDYAGQGSPAWSPDGDQIAFDAWGPPDDEQAHVFVVDENGANLRDFGPGAMPNWSPRDDTITLCRHSPKWGTWRVNSKGLETQIVHAFSPQWSPSGNMLAVITPPGVGLAVCDKDGSNLKSVAPGILHGIGWSPDAKYICGARDSGDGQYEMVVVAMTNRTTKSRLTGDLGTQMKWSPDGKWIVFSMRTDQLPNHQLYIVEPHGHSPPLLIRGQDPRRANVDPAWSPDGKRLAFASNPVPSEN